MYSYFSSNIFYNEYVKHSSQKLISIYYIEISRYYILGEFSFLKNIMNNCGSAVSLDMIYKENY